MTYETEFYIDDTLSDFDVKVNGEYISMYDGIFDEAFGDNNVCVLNIPEMPLRKWFAKYWPSNDSFEDWITGEQNADEMMGFLDEYKDLYDLNPKRIGFQKYIDALKEKSYNKWNIIITNDVNSVVDMMEFYGTVSKVKEYLRQLLAENFDLTGKEVKELKAPNQVLQITNDGENCYGDGKGSRAYSYYYTAILDNIVHEDDGIYDFYTMNIK